MTIGDTLILIGCFAVALWVLGQAFARWAQLVGHILDRLPSPRLQRRKRQHSPEYVAYMRSDEWREMRQRKLDQAGRECEKCGATSALEVHHKTYRRLWNERMSDLQVLCDDCHNDVHAKTGRLTYA